MHDLLGSFTCLKYLISWYSPQNGLATKVEKSRKQIKERKNRTKKIRGVKKVSFSTAFLTHVTH
jgi:hypothetical protein